jgi:preprotein translocase subunit SecB
MSQNNPQQVEVGIIRIYVKDFSFESPKVPQAFQKQVHPELKIEVNVRPKNVNGPVYEVALNLLIEAESENEPFFVVEIEHAGLFEIKNANQEQLDHILTVFAPSTLFPYARAVIDQAMLNGSLPPLSLAPINFDAMRMQRLQQAAAQQSAAQQPTSVPAEMKN